jgi:hypothetical protein
MRTEEIRRCFSRRQDSADGESRKLHHDALSSRKEPSRPRSSRPARLSSKHNEKASIYVRYINLRLLKHYNGRGPLPKADEQEGIGRISNLVDIGLRRHFKAFP